MRPVRRFNRESPSATSPRDAPSSGAAPIGRRGCWSNTPRPRSSRTCCAAPVLRRSSRAISRPASCSRISPPISASSIASASRTSPICERSARRSSAASARRRMRSTRATSRWRGRPTRSARGGGSIPTWGGLRLYRTMRDAEPDVFIHCGDTIYADGVVQPQVKLDDGSMWTNIVTEAKSKVAQTLDDYRGCYKYNLLDEHMRTFNAGVGQIATLGRPRGARQLVRHARSQRRRALPGQEHGAALSARAAGVPRVQPGWPSRRRRGADPSHHRLRAAAGHLRAGSAQLPRREQRQSSGVAVAGVRDFRRRPARVLQGSPREQPRDVEGHRQRHADRR